MSADVRQPGYLREAWLVLLLSLLFGGSLAAVQRGLSPKIEANKEHETLSQVPNLVPGGTPDDAEAVTVGEQRVYRVVKDGRLLGWVVPTSGQGFADRLELLLGLDPTAEKLLGLYVLEQKETPGLGNRIGERDWQQQFADRPATALSAVHHEPGEGEVRAITGATISSQGVCEIVNRTIQQLRQPLAAAAREVTR